MDEDGKKYLSTINIGNIISTMDKSGIIEKFVIINSITVTQKNLYFLSDYHQTFKLKVVEMRNEDGYVKVKKYKGEDKGEILVKLIGSLI